MITFIIIVLSLTIVGVGFAYKEITSLRKEVDEIHNRISVTDQQTHSIINEELEKLHFLVRTMESDIKSDTKEKLQKLTEQIIKKIPPTNDELIKRISDLEEGSHRLRMNM